MASPDLVPSKSISELSLPVHPVDHAPPTNPSHFRVEAGAPQLIRLAGFRDVFARYHNSLDNAVCDFGPDDKVDCRCDTLQGTMECDVPRSDHVSTDEHTDTLTVRAKVAEFETPLMVIRYHVTPFEEHNVLMAPDDFQPDDFQPETRPNLHRRLLAYITGDRQGHRKGTIHTRTAALLHQCVAECIGTMFIVVFGVGSVCVAILTNTSSGLWQIATVWGFGVALAILATASVSGAHLNPAVSLAMALFRPNDFSFRKLIPYWCAQYLGGVLGGAFNLMIYGPLFRYHEQQGGIVRGSAESVLTARAFGEYFPDPGLGPTIISPEVVSPAFAMFVEAWGTGILMFVILALTDSRQKIIQNKEMLPFYIGFTVAVLITLYAPLTQAGWNPARDFGPRLVAAMAGWGKIAIPGPRNGFWVYIVGPKIGAPIGALLYDLLIARGLRE